ncbi:MAG TPA: tRNA preQ1(34) S-adenosylmethionine ribosyltransferase-isomerase QueA [Myxococcota bacterium]|nr:tRNA preQ1(34) S-adenosylmethionine ribosyltransferase-isomerase QueA [Myxococcota bacterium]
MTPADFDFDLPEDQIARFPLPQRDASRLLVVGATPPDHQIHQLPSLLRAGDLLVLNDVRVRRARLAARRATGGEVEALLVGADEALLRPARRLKVGERLICGAGHLVLVAQRADGCWQVRGDPDLATLEQTAGSLPIPPYLGRQAEQADAERYQTVYASDRSGFAASAAPTAGLHISPALLEELQQRGVELARVGLEVGLGTFQPLREEQLREGKLHVERYDLPVETWEAIARTRARGGRVVAVGTTVTRVLESAPGPGQGETTLFIRPGFSFRQVDLLLTNFHLPQSSLLMLVCAFGGKEAVLSAYAHAIAAGYRFYSYGDAMLLQRA